MTRTAFVGLGVMGYPMAGHLQAAGHPTCVFNRTGSKAEGWVADHGGRSESTPAAAAAGAELVMLCVGNDDDVRQVALGQDGALAGMAEGSILVDHTTTSATLARELDRACREKGVGFLDAPVSGGQAGAENGVLTIMVGGEQAVFDRAERVLDVYARRVRLMGPAGSGQLTKMVNQICLAGLIQGLSEGLSFAINAGLDAKAVVDVISQGAAQSWQMDHRHETMIDDKYDHGFAVDWMRKDLGVALEEAGRNGSRLEVAALVDGFYEEIQAMGGNRWDTSSLMRRLPH